MREIIDVAKKVLAMILVVALIVINLPTNTIWAKSNKNDETENITVYVNVVNAQGADVLNEELEETMELEFKLSDGVRFVDGGGTVRASSDIEKVQHEVTVVENPSITTEDILNSSNTTDNTTAIVNCYVLELEKNKDIESFDITIHEKNNRIYVNKIKCSKDVEYYPVQLHKYADLHSISLDANDTSTQFAVKYSSAEYSLSTGYANECTLTFADDVELAVGNGVTVEYVGEDDNKSKVCKLSGLKPGTTEIGISSKNNEFTKTTFTLTMSNDISFTLENDTIDVANLSVPTNKITIGNFEYADSVTVSSDNERVVKVVKAENNTIQLEIIGKGTAKITVKCDITNVTKTKDITITASSSNVNLYRYADDADTDGGNVSNGEYINLDALAMYGKTIKVIGSVDSLFPYNISYSVAGSDSNLAVTVADDGTVTINRGGFATINVVAENSIFPWLKYSASYNVVARPNTEVGASIYIDNASEKKIIEEDEVVELKDELDENGHIRINYEDGTEILPLPLQYELVDKDGNVIDNDNTVVTFWSDKLTIKDNIIKNADDIVRNEEFTVTMTIHDNMSRFEDITKKIRIVLKSNRTKNEGNKYYEVKGIVEGYDQNLWVNANCEKIEADGGNLYELSGDGDSEVWTYLYSVPYGSSETYDKEHKIVVKPKLGNLDVTRLFFGVDIQKPEIVRTTVNGQGGDNIDGNFNGEVVIKVVANDTEALNDGNTVNNLHIAYLKNGEEILSQAYPNKNKDGFDEFVFTLNATDIATLYDNLFIQVDDVARNSATQSIGSILLEKDSPSATIALKEGNNVDYTDATGKMYSDEDVYVDISFTDIVKLIDANMSSGLASYEITVSGRENTTIKKEYTEKKTEDVYTIYTGDYEKAADGRITISVNKITDKAGNVWQPNGSDVISYTIYIDKEGATVTYSDIVTNGTKNVTPYGNFYNKEIKYILNVSDSMSGVDSVVLKVGDKTFNGTIEGEVATIIVPVGAVGQATLELKDKMGNPTVVELNKLKNIEGTNVFISNYILIEDDIVKEPTYTMRQADKGNWYKSQVDLDIAITDETSGKLSSGLSKVKIYINDKEYQTKIYNDRNVIKDSVNVSINNQWIHDTINNAGAYTIKLVVIDNAGNESVYNKTVYIDTVAPVISEISGVANNSVNTGTVTVDVEVSEKHYAEAGNKTVVTVARTLDGKTVTYEADKFILTSETTKKPYMFTEDGFYTVVVTTEDAAGNKGISKSITFTVDNTAPLADITGVSTNGFYKDKAEVKIDVIESNFADMNVSVGITVELNGETRTIDNVVFNGTQKNSSLTHTFTEEGKYTVKVDAVDAAGNVALTKTVVFTVDTSAPTISISGVKDGTAYKGDVIPVISITDNYYKNYSVSLVKTGVYFSEDLSNVSCISEVDVTDMFISSLTNVKNGVKGTFDTFEKIQGNDGIYTLTVIATDYAGRVSKETVHFTINRFGSVYAFDDNLRNIINTSTTNVDTDFKITEYNADRLVADSVNIRITRDGAPLDDVIVEKTAIGTENVTGDSGWYQYEYVISKDNFAYDGVYVITVSSADEAGNNSENITYDELSIRFSVDTTKPELVMLTDLSDGTYNATSKDVEYEVFDAIGIKEVKVYLNGECIQTVSDFDDITSYSGVFTINEGYKQHVNFEIVDMAGNVINSDNAIDMELGKIVNFVDEITVSTDVFIRWYANKPLFYGTIAVTGSAVAGGSTALVLRRRKLRLKIKK